MKNQIKKELNSPIFKSVYLEWCDAISGDDNWINVNDALEWGDNEDWVIKQTCFIIKETKEYLLLAGKLNPHGNGGDLMISQLVKLPKTWIRKRVDLSKVIR